MVTHDERLEFKVGVPVEAVDGPVGRLRQVVINPGDGRVSALAVRRSRLPALDFVVPVEAIESASDDVIKLKLTKDEVESQPFLRERYLVPTLGMSGYPGGQVLFSLLGERKSKGGGPQESGDGWTGSPAIVIRAGQLVEATDGEVGRVDRVLVNGAMKRATHFTVREGPLLRRDIMVPVEWIAEWRPDLMKLGVDKATLEYLPVYHPDQELQWAVEDALWGDPALLDDVLYFYPISVSAHGWVVTLRGHVRSAAHKQRAEDLTAGVAGVLGVNNHLIADDELEQAVTLTLAGDPRTRDLPVRVHSWFGYVHLNGDVPTREARAAAEEIAANVLGVRDVVNLLGVAGVPTHWEQERLRELGTGQPVYVRQAVIGQVEKLLVDPQTWRITALAVRTKPSDALGSQPGQPERRETIVVPVEHVEQVTVGGVYLSLTEEEVKRLPRFDPVDYPSPDPDWQPPALYRREDIALDQAAHPQSWAGIAEVG